MARRNAAENPAARGFRMPAEWEPQRATWMSWPHNRSDWPGKFAPIPYVYAEIVRHLARAARAELIVNDAAAEAAARSVLKDANVLPALAGSIGFHRWPTNRGWLRDSGPIFVYANNGELVATNWRFNAWAKYRNWQLDDTMPEKIARRRRMRLFGATVEVQGQVRQMVLEGGSIDVNGGGLLLTTEECLLSTVQQRNPGMTREEVENALGAMLGAKKVLWLERGIVGDDTHGHVDDIARFVGPRTVVAAVEEDPEDDNYAILHDNLQRLRTMTDLQGRPLEVVRLPMPAPVVFKGQRVPASYANFYISNRTVLVPTFNDPHDLNALNLIQTVLPRHRVIPIYCGDLIWGLGAIHCMTQQEPEGRQP